MTGGASQIFRRIFLHILQENWEKSGIELTSDGFVDGFDRVRIQGSTIGASFSHGLKEERDEQTTKVMRLKFLEREIGELKSERDEPACVTGAFCFFKDFFY